jgi:hypothetical protein
VPKALRLLQHLFAVGKQHISPHLDIARSDACEVAKARPGKRQVVLARRLARDRVEVREREHVRQMAHCSERRVMVLGRHAQHLRTNRSPGVGGFLHKLGSGLRQRRQDDLTAVVERGVGMGDAGRFLAGDRVRRHERADALLQHTARGVDDVALGRADIHEQHAGFDEMADCLERRLGGRDRNGDQHDVGTRHREQRRLGDLIDHAELLRLLGGRRRLAVADHALDQAGALERERERAAHQAASDQSELVEHCCDRLNARRSGRSRAT